MTCPKESPVARRTHAEYLSRRTSAQLLGDDGLKPVGIDPKARTANMLALIPSTSKSSLHPFNEEAPFELGNGSDDRKDCLPEG